MVLNRWQKVYIQHKATLPNKLVEQIQMQRFKLQKEKENGLCSLHDSSGFNFSLQVNESCQVVLHVSKQTTTVKSH